ncbi:peroxiredoxin [Candidatus Saccharibacteria bacterium]|nr:peroxiredoxin [Candidatus Saccharibacteria bacterium]
MSIEAGKKAPDFNLPDQDGKNHKLSDLKGNITLIYFYPKDETPGCTIQACSLRDNFELLQKDGVNVVGVSKDDVASHAKFSKHHKLPFPILADPDKKMIEAYEAWGERNLYGRKFMGTVRSAVLVGPKLTVLRHWPKISPLKTVPEVRKWLKQQTT